MRPPAVLLRLAARMTLIVHHIQAAPHFMSTKIRPNFPLMEGCDYGNNNEGPINFLAFHEVTASTRQRNEKQNALNPEVNKPRNNTVEHAEAVGVKNKAKRFLRTTGNNDTQNKAENKLWSERISASEKFKFGVNNTMNDYKDYHVDDEDVRTDSKSAYVIWPFFYHRPYEYEPLKPDVEVEKAKDKRFVNPRINTPVREKLIYATPESTTQDLKQTNTADATDNPIFGNKPFFSYVLNEYFDKTDEEDPMNFKGLSWGKEFDHELAQQDIDDYTRRIRRLEEYNPKTNNEERANRNLGYDTINDSSNIKSQDFQHESENSEKSSETSNNYGRGYKYNGDSHRGFKDFADSFANRFGSEDHDRDAKYFIKSNEDKGEKKKGFRKIYHKDEYQEHQDYFDNTDNSKHFEDKGTSKIHLGGAEAFLSSQAAEALGNDRKEVSNEENNKKRQHEINHKDKQRFYGIDGEFNQYRNVAKNTALSNIADYVDRYTV